MKEADRHDTSVVNFEPTQINNTLRIRDESWDETRIQVIQICKYFQLIKYKLHNLLS